MSKPKQSFELKIVNSIPCKQGAVRNVRFNVDGNYCITCGSDKSLKLWNPIRSRLLQTYTGHGYEVLDAQGSSDSAQIASCGMDKMVFLWDVSTSQAVRRFRGHAAQVNAVKFNEESSVILSGSLDGTVRIWDCKSRSKDPIQILDEAKDSVTSIQVSDHEILTGSLDNCIRRYDIRKGEMNSDNLGRAVTSVTFTRDGQCVLISCLDSTLKLLDKDTGEMLAELVIRMGLGIDPDGFFFPFRFVGHKNKEYRIDSCLSSSDAQVLSGSEDGAVYCWDLVEGSLITKLEHQGHRVVHSLSFHPTTMCLLTATEGHVYIWHKDPLPPEEEEEDTPIM